MRLARDAVDDGNGMMVIMFKPNGRGAPTSAASANQIARNAAFRIHIFVGPVSTTSFLLAR